jgi:hypothetical protein
LISRQNDLHRFGPLPEFLAALAAQPTYAWFTPTAECTNSTAALFFGFGKEYRIRVFERDGKWLGDVTMPERFLPHEIGADYAIGVTRDDDGVETVVLYALAPSRTPR